MRLEQGHEFSHVHRQSDCIGSTALANATNICANMCSVMNMQTALVLQIKLMLQTIMLTCGQFEHANNIDCTVC